MPPRNRRRSTRRSDKDAAARGAGTRGARVAKAKPASGSKGQATINDIARLAGVSKKTVSRVINRSPLVRPDTREKIEALMREHDYAPDPMARGLAFRRSFLIGMVYDNPNSEYIINMQNGALDGLRGSGFELVVHPCDSKRLDYIDGVRAFALQQRLHGVILPSRVSEDQTLVEMLREIDCPYVCLAAIDLGHAERMIVTNDRAGTVEVARYLDALGHKHIGLITGPERYLSSRERGAGLINTLAERGVKIGKKYIVEGGYTFESGVLCAERLLALSPRPTAILALNDEMAAGVFKAAHRLGLRIPEQLSVVGFDDSPLASRLWPSLTTVRLPIRDMGLRAASMLLAESGPVQPVSFTPHLVVRESCQPPPS